MKSGIIFVFQAPYNGTGIRAASIDTQLKRKTGICWVPVILGTPVFQARYDAKTEGVST